LSLFYLQLKTTGLESLLKIAAIQFYRGANIYANRPVMVLSISGMAGPDLDINALRQALCGPPFNIDPGADASLPTLAEGQSVAPIALIASLAIFLQAAAGAQVDFHTTENVNDNEARAIFSFEDETCAQEAGWLAFALIAWFLTSPRPATQVLAQRLEIFREHAPHTAASMYTLPMLQAARKRNIPWSRLPDSNYYRLGSGSRQQVILESGAQANNWIASRIASRKALTRDLLAAQGVPVPWQLTVNSSAGAVQAAEEIGYPVVVKPPNMNQGTGVHLNLKSDTEVRSAFAAVQHYSPEILVEEYVAGKDYRLLVVGEELVAAAWRRPPQVTGDGVSSIQTLIKVLNQDPLRGKHNLAPLSKIKIDDEITRTLAEQDLTIDAVLTAGRTAPLRRLPSVTLGGEPLGLLERVHPHNRQLAIDAAATLGLAIAGVDFLCPDISQSYTEVGGAICEMNTVPGLNAHYNMPGGMPGVAGKIIDMMFPDPAAARIPVIVAPGQTELTRKLVHECTARGHRPGSWIDGKALVNKRVPETCDIPQIADVLRSPLVDVACLAPEPGSLVNDGLGFDQATWAVLLTQDIPPAAAALLAKYCDKILLPENAAVPDPWSSETRSKITWLPAASDAVSWLTQEIDQAIKRWT
jgi:cyanophycin synthetase